MHDTSVASSLGAERSDGADLAERRRRDTGRNSRKGYPRGRGRVALGRKSADFRLKEKLVQETKKG
jgi:hypothetical protein